MNRKIFAWIQNKSRSIPYHLIDIFESSKKYNINRFYFDFVQAMETITHLSQTPILWGGIVLYIQTILEGNELSTTPTNSKLRENLHWFEKTDIKRLFKKMNPILKEN